MVCVTKRKAGKYDGEVNITTKSLNKWAVDHTNI